MRQAKNNHSNYHDDFYKWIKSQASHLKKGDYSKLDIENLVEEIESLGRSDRRAIRNYLVVLLLHLLKTTYTPDQKGNSRSWEASIINSKKEIRYLLEDSPSLRNELKKVLEDAYSTAREMAVVESIGSTENTFPKTCPWTLKEILGN